MNLFERLLDRFIMLATAVLGFVAGLAALLVAGLFDLGAAFWPTAIGLLLAAMLVFFLIDRFDGLWTRGLVNGLMKASGQSAAEREEDERQEKQQNRLGRYAFLIGAVAAFIAGAIVPPEQIMDDF